MKTLILSQRSIAALSFQNCTWSFKCVILTSQVHTPVVLILINTEK
jgi:hypothetical protein